MYLNRSRSVLRTQDLSSHPELITSRQSCCPRSPNPQIPISPPGSPGAAYPLLLSDPFKCSHSSHQTTQQTRTQTHTRRFNGGSTAVQRPSLFPVEEIWRYRLWRGSALSSVELALSLKSSIIILKGSLAKLAIQK